MHLRYVRAFLQTAVKPIMVVNRIFHNIGIAIHPYFHTFMILFNVFVFGDVVARLDFIVC